MEATRGSGNIRARLEKRDWTARKLDGTRKATSEQASTRRTGKTTEGEKAPQSAYGQPTAAPELKCYNCFGLGYISCNCPNPKTEKTK
ncbi:hypothetical protein GP486_008218 [Trichoglossum hirsutum]|uniref:CCHC-type domain-containing protein n=1 Tax=Trichoglossum hirsutum TaxID=265104 RepID=A0A9P8L4A5_9PEZI|nr:hypothetical protein GP486_008218 [Trichoglossum hirsutum]